MPFLNHMKMQMGSHYLNKFETNSTNEQTMTARGKRLTHKKVTVTRDTSPCLLISAHEGLDSGVCVLVCDCELFLFCFF